MQFVKNIFNPRLVESVNVEARNTEANCNYNRNTIVPWVSSTTLVECRVGKIQINKSGHKLKCWPRRWLCGTLLYYWILCTLYVVYV
jgi:hypothetical protein